MNGFADVNEISVDVIPCAQVGNADAKAGSDSAERVSTMHAIYRCVADGGVVRGFV